MINPCLEPATVNGSLVSRDSGVCGAHGICESLSAGNYQCKCDRDYKGNHCHISKFVIIIDGLTQNWESFVFGFFRFVSCFMLVSLFWTILLVF